MRAHLFVGIFSFCFWLQAQNGISKEDALSKIVSLQAVNHDFYDDGLFPSQRTWFSGFGGEEDNTVFTTASVVYILRNVHKISPNTRIEEVIKRGIPNFEKYRSRNGKPAYNNWQTIPPDLPFPNSSLLSRERFRLPDDYDDTALVQLAKGPNSLDGQVRSEMLGYASRKNRKKVRSFPKDYKNFMAYEVWFADKMEQEYDVVVMSNVLLFVLAKGFDHEEPDTETIKLIQSIVRDQSYFSRPKEISPYYGSTTLILYHLARLAELDTKDVLGIRQDLIVDLRQALTQPTTEIGKLLLFTSLKRLGASPEPRINKEILLGELAEFEFYNYQPSSGFMGLLPKMTWRCEALNWALLLEFLTYYEGEIIWES